MPSLKNFYCDTETTGTDPHKHGIIQFSGRMYVAGVASDHELNLKIQPFETDEVTDEALEVNGVSRDELFSTDRMTPRHAFMLITRYLSETIDKYDKQDKAFFCGFRAQFDSDFLRAFMAKNGDTYYGSWFWTPVNDVMILAGYILKKWRHMMVNFKLKTVYEFIFPELKDKWTEEDWHDAMFDIERTIDVEQGLREILTGKRKLPPPTW